ncbi:MAG: UDP-N-acetylglucosamine 2-epimerase [Chthoniobacter sp.]|uniref:UDP-N-acetylglucosamine 2-epimerase n=1 Tax=Chthoniobacter sp. TaxID=2510640 RepID=UPI0032AB209E
MNQFAKKIGICTFARSEYGSILPVLWAITADPSLELQLIVGGSHLTAGRSIEQIEKDGFPTSERIDFLISSDSPEAIVKGNSVAASALAEVFTRQRPDILLLVGDRFELLAAASAATAFNIPIAHVSGGEVTEGAIDDVVRHAVSKMSHLHFVASQEQSDMLRAMGESPGRIHVTGDPALDAIHRRELLSREELATQLEIDLTPPVIVLTHHPSTRDPGAALLELEGILAVLKETPGTVIATAPNSDAGHQVLRGRLETFVQERPGSILRECLGQLRFYSLMRHADLMIGNSSSGIWEAPSFQLPVVNVGDRQRGRMRAGNVIDTSGDVAEIRAAVTRTLDPAWRVKLKAQPNPYGDGHAAGRIVNILKSTALGSELLIKESPLRISAGKTTS